MDAGDVGELGASTRAAQHVLAYALLELDGRLALSLGDGLAVEALVPLEIAVLNARFTDDKGMRIPALEALHDRKGSIIALGDPQVSGRFRLVGAGDPASLLVDLRVGVALPFGYTVENPFRTGARGEPHEHIYFGTGTLDPLVGAQLSLPVGAMRAFTYVWARLVLYEAGSGFRGGNRYSGGAGVELGPEDVRVRAVASAYHQTADRWDGAASPESVKKMDVAFTGAVRFFSLAGWPLELALTIPLTVQSSGGIDHSSPSVFSATLEHAFEL